MTTPADHDAILILQPLALAPGNEDDRERYVHLFAEQLGVEGETERATVTDISTEGTGQVIRFPVSQAALKAVEGGPAWSRRAAELFLVPDTAG
jgi:hypothetical protein